MVDIVVKYKGLTGAQNELTIDNGQTVNQLLTAIAADEGITSSHYNIALSRDYTVNETTSGGSTLTSLDIVTGDEFLCTPDQSGNKEAKQKQKLDIAAAKRGETYDITELPTQYLGNDIVDNPNSSGLLVGRPWSADGITLDELVANLDPKIASGTTIIDQSGNDNDATIVGGATYDETEDAVVLDGVDDYIRTTNLYSAIGNPDTFSVGVWAKPAASGVVVQMTNTTTPEVEYHFSAIEFVESAGNPVPYFGLWNGSDITDDNGTALSYDTWYHMVLTYNGTAVKGYINGSEVASANVTFDSPHDDGETAQYLLFGPGTTTNMGDGGFYTGGIGEARIYNKALSPAEVLENYNTTKGRYGL